MREKLEPGKYYEVEYPMKKQFYTLYCKSISTETGNYFIEAYSHNKKKWQANGAIVPRRIKSIREVTELYAKELIEEETNRAARHLLKEDY